MASGTSLLPLTAKLIPYPIPNPRLQSQLPRLQLGGGGECSRLLRGGGAGWQHLVPAAVSNRTDAEASTVVKRPSSGAFKVLDGMPEPLGATACDDGVNFAIYSSTATAATLCLFTLDDLKAVRLHSFLITFASPSASAFGLIDSSLSQSDLVSLIRFFFLTVHAEQSYRGGTVGS